MVSLRSNPGQPDTPTCWCDLCLGDVNYAGIGRSRRIDDATLIRSDVQLIPKCQLRPLRVCFHLRVAGRTGVLGRTRRRDDGRVHDGSRAQQYRLFPSIVNAITVVKPETVIGWHRRGFRAYWRWKSRRRGLFNERWGRTLL